MIPEIGTVNIVKSLQHVLEELDLTLSQLSKIIGESEATLSRLFATKEAKLKLGAKEFELSLLLIRAYRSLAVIVGDDRENCRQWFHSYNAYFDNTPLNEAYRVEGLVNVCLYLERHK